VDSPVARLTGRHLSGDHFVINAFRGQSAFHYFQAAQPYLRQPLPTRTDARQDGQTYAVHYAEFIEREFKTEFKSMNFFAHVMLYNDTYTLIAETRPNKPRLLCREIYFQRSLCLTRVCPPSPGVSPAPRRVTHVCVGNDSPNFVYIGLDLTPCTPLTSSGLQWTIIAECGPLCFQRNSITVGNIFDDVCVCYAVVATTCVLAVPLPCISVLSHI
jgi:hypothetical protein